MSAQKSSLNYDYKDTETSLTFNWRPPRQSECDKFSALAQYYHFKLVNLDREDDKYSHNGIVPDNQTKIAQLSLEELHNAGLIPANQTQLTLEDLHPNSCYALFVFLTNSIGEYQYNTHTHTLNSVCVLALDEVKNGQGDSRGGNITPQENIFQTILAPKFTPQLSKHLGFTSLF